MWEKPRSEASLPWFLETMSPATLAATLQICTGLSSSIWPSLSVRILSRATVSVSGISGKHPRCSTAPQRGLSPISPPIFRLNGIPTPLSVGIHRGQIIMVKHFLSKHHVTTANVALLSLSSQVQSSLTSPCSSRFIGYPQAAIVVDAACPSIGLVVMLLPADSDLHRPRMLNDGVQDADPRQRMSRQPPNRGDQLPISWSASGRDHRRERCDRRVGE
jgi:hypothetical protein